MSGGPRTRPHWRRKGYAYRKAGALIKSAERDELEEEELKRVRRCIR
jgi:hypothetical protein